MPKLVFIDPNFAGKVYPLIIERTSVGRGDENTLVIRDSSLSARHCEILVNGAEVIVRDLGSRNGTTVNGQLLKNQQSAVKNGQIVQFGLVGARLEIETAASPEGIDAESAVVDLRQAMREQRRAQKNPAPADPSAKLDSAAQNRLEPQTIFVPREAPVAQGKSSGNAAIREAEQQAGPRGLTWLWTALAAAGVVLAVWLLWGRK